MQTLKIASLELRLRRMPKKFAVFLAFTFVLIIFSTYYVAKNGIGIDEGIYSTNVELPSKAFTTSDNPDLVVSNGRVFIKNNLKSYSAFDEFRRLIRVEYNNWLYERFGDSAFPVLVKVFRVPTKVELKVGTVKSVTPEIPTTPTAQITQTPQATAVTPKSIGEEGRIGKKIGEIEGVKAEKGFVLPENLQPPILLKKFVYTFLIVMPFYLLAQIYSSSLMEDKIKKRFDVLITATSHKAVVFGKLLPYVAMSTALAIVISAFLNKPLIPILLMPVVVFILAVDCFLVFIARSYKELSFLSIVVTIVITAYLFIPSIFTVIPMSRLSPITLLVQHLSDEHVDLSDIFMAVAHLSLMSAVLLYISLNSFEIVYSQRGIVDKLLDVTTQLVDRYYKVFLASLISIPFVLLMEFFTLSLTFAFRNYFILLLLILAIVEEFFKGLFTYSAYKNGLNTYLSAFLSALGFLIGEKALLLTFIPAEYARLLIFPLVAHVLATISFVLVIRWGFRSAVGVSALIHTTYNGLVVCLLLRWL